MGLKQISSHAALRNLLAFCCICILGIAVYIHTLHAPWYLDDVINIVENRAILNLSEAFNNALSGSRGIAELTFALNHHFGGMEVRGFHLVNIGIHLLCALLVFLILTRICGNKRLYPLFGSLIFLVHPLQTQAVTYIVQRMTSLAALFFLLAVFLYIRFRESDQPRRWIFYSTAIASGALAVLTKQNTAVLPLVLLLVDHYFLQHYRPLAWRTRLAGILPFALVPIGVAVQYLLLPLLDHASPTSLGGMPDLVHLRNNSPLHYLVTQFSVIFIYVRLLFIPYGQALEYDVPIVASIWSWQNGLALTGILLLFYLAFYLRRRAPLISAGILWFFLGLAVESTIIPLDPVFEHRLYLPMFGFVLVVLGCLQKLPGKGVVICSLVIIGAFSVLTWQRNALWNDPVAFYQDNLRRTPNHERVHLDLGNLYMRENRVAEARHHYEKALQINPDYVLIHINLARAYAAQGLYQKGVDILLEGIRINPFHFRLYNNLAVLYNSVGKFQEAAFYLNKGLALDPFNPTVHFNLGIAYERLGRLDDAIDHFRRSLSLSPAAPETHFNLGLALHRQGNQAAALQSFLQAAQLDPNHAGTLYNAALISLDMGNRDAALGYLARLQQLNTVYAQRLRGRLHEAGKSQP